MIYCVIYRVIHCDTRVSHGSRSLVARELRPLAIGAQIAVLFVRQILLFDGLVVVDEAEVVELVGGALVTCVSHIYHDCIVCIIVCIIDVSRVSHIS